ncbi:MAG: hypothetical protein QM767_16325 [Anaeromyxobacter sp.]
MPRDPRYRPFRLALWAIYFVILAIALSVVITSIARHLRGPVRPAAAGTLPTRAALRVCVTDLEALQREQNERAWKLGAEIGEGDAIARWDEWSHDWERRVDDLADRCRLDAADRDPQGFGGREELAKARDAVMTLHRAYRGQVYRFAQEEAAQAVAAQQALEQARAAVVK